jgi:SAM-dependent methyltransferase
MCSVGRIFSSKEVNMVETREFYNKRRDFYEVTRSFYLKGRESTLFKLFEFINKRQLKSFTFLDFGCATGNHLAKVGNNFPNAYLFGVDNSFGMLSKAYERMMPYNDRTTLQDSVKYISNKVDFIFTSYTISAVGEYTVPMLQNMLNPKGLIAVCDFSEFSDLGQSLFKINGNMFTKRTEIKKELQKKFEEKYS